MSREYYAYGDFEVAGHQCPINAAGMLGREFADELGEEFDEWARDATGPSEGILNPDQAKKVWAKMTDGLAHRAEQDADSFSAALHDLAEEVREELDW